MTTSSLVINYNAISSRRSHSPWVKLEQIVPKNLARYATIKDLYDFWLTAKTGSSAQLIKKSDVCPVEIENGIIRLWIDFYVWLSNPATPYSLQIGIGTLGERVYIEAHKAFSLLANNTTEIDLPHYFANYTSFTWESPTFDRDGNQIYDVGISLVDGCWLQFSEEVFGVVRVSGNAIGYKERLTIEVDKGEETEGGTWVEYTLEDFNVDITVTTADNEEIMHLTDATLPECINTLLTMCPNQENIDMCETFAQAGLLGKLMTVYYNSCTGEVIHVELSSLRDSNFCK
jgi:hypothetical protein